MKRIKGILAITISLVILFASIPAMPVFAETHSGNCGTNVTWSLDTESGVLTISGSGSMYNYNRAPWYSQSGNIKSVNIENGVTSIGNSAFLGCSSLTSIKIPNSVTFIGFKAFSGCSSLTSITIPDGVTGIGNYAFFNCSSLTSITIPNSVTSIGDSAFEGCSSLTSITIPDGVTGIGNYAFFNCSSLTSIKIPDSVTIIGSGAFDGCSSLTSVTIPDSVTRINDWAFYHCSSLASITIPDSVTSIGDSAFEGCSSLTSITIPDSVTSIGNIAFSGCSSLTSITIPNSVTSIGDSAFEGCSSLVAINVGGGNKSYSSQDGVLFNKKKTILICCPGGKLGGYVIPDSVTSIGDSAFFGCSSLTSITIPDSITIIGFEAFSGCSSITSLTIPDSVTSINSSAFENCTSLTSIIVPDGVTSIGQSTFSGCTGLTSITIPDSVTIIYYSAFSSCTSLTSITIPDSVTEIEDGAFNYCSSLVAINVGGGNKGYSSQDGVLFNKDKTELILCPEGKSREYVIPDGVIRIGRYAFYNCSNLTSITIPDSVTSIGSNAFYNCSSLTNIKIPDSVTSIGKGAFSGCTGLTSITIPFVGATKDGTSNTHFGYIFGAWSYSDSSGYVPKSLKTVEITGGASIDYDAFRGCNSLTSVTIPDSVTSIGCNAFDGCSSLTSITIPFVGAAKDGTSNTHFGYIFGASSYSDNSGYVPESLKTVVITGGTSIGSNAFYNCSSLTSITIPDSITSIGFEAFSGCSSLASITIPFVGATKDGTSNTHFGYIFGASSYSDNSSYVPQSLKTVEITGGTSIGSNAFYNCSSLTNIKIPDSVTSIGKGAFSGCTGLTSITIPFVGATKDGTSNTHFGYIFGASSDNSGYVPKSLKTVEITGGKSIGGSAFRGCSLTSITIPDSVTSIGDLAFHNCGSLKNVNITDISKWCNINFEGYISNPCYYGADLYLNGNKVTALEIPSGITSIGTSAFNGCSSLTSITIPDSVTSMGNYAFFNCSSLTSITIGNGVTSIGSQAFDNCQNLKTVYNLSALPIVKGNSSYGYVAYYADAVYTCDSYGGLSLLFSKDNGLLKISGTGEMPNFNLFSSTPWYKYADQIKAVEIDESITKVGTYSFYWLTNLKELATGNKDLQFGMYAINPSVDFKIYSLPGGTLENYCKTNNVDFEPPLTAPELDSVTSNSITVKAVNGFEYSKDGTAWQSSNIFTGLNAVTEYSIYTRRKGMLTELASAASPALKVKTVKNTADTPANPFVIDVDESTVTLKPIEGYEYSKDGVNWQTSNVFTELDKNVIYNFYQRRAETYDTFASANSDAARAAVVANPTIVFVGATTLKVSKTEGFEYSLDKITWQTSDTFTMLIPELNYTVYQRPTNTLVYYVIGEGTTVNINGKDMAPTPEEPTLLNKSDTTVTLTAVAGCEYKMDNGNWQDSNVFENLSPFTEYTFYQRVKETDTSAASESSVGLKVITDKAYTLGDVNCNGTVDIIDLQRLYAHLNGSNPLGELSYGDVNCNGTVDIIDLQRLYAHLNGSNLLF